MIQPPTDNLYKFLSIFGLVIIVTSVVGAYQSFSDWSTHLIEERFQFAKNAVASEAASKARYSIIGQMIDASKTGETAKFEELRKQLEAPQNKDIPLLDSPELTKIQDESKILRDRASLMGDLAAVGIAFGLALSTAGFFLWYSRVQVFMDQKLRAEAKPNPPVGQQ